jgi:hypothetical protein
MVVAIVVFSVSAFLGCLPLRRDVARARQVHLFEAIV